LTVRTVFTVNFGGGGAGSVWDVFGGADGVLAGESVERPIVPRGTIWKRAENACISLLFDGVEDGSAGKKHGEQTCFLR